MAMRRKLEVAFVDKDWDLTQPPSARSWHPLSKACGLKAMNDEKEFRLNGGGCSFGACPHAMYRWHSSVPTNSGPMKVYAHGRNRSDPGNPRRKPWENCYVMVRFAPTLRVLVLPKPDLALPPPHVPHTKIELFQMGHCMPVATILWSMTFPHDVEDVTLKMILDTAKKDLVKQEHVTSSGKVLFYFDGQEVTTKPATVLVKRTRSRRQPACIASFLFVLDCAVTTASRCASLSHERLQPLHSFIIIILLLIQSSSEAASQRRRRAHAGGGGDAADEAAAQASG